MGEETNPKGELPGTWAGHIGKQVCRAEACQGVGRVICELRAGRPSNAALKSGGGGGLLQDGSGISGREAEERDLSRLSVGLKGPQHQEERRQLSKITKGRVCRIAISWI